MLIEYVRERSAVVRRGKLGMRSDDNDIPHPTDADRADCYFVGEGAVVHLERVTQGLSAVAISGAKGMVIVTPFDPSAEAVWLSFDRADCEISPLGQLGILKQRPDRVQVTSGDVAFRIGDAMQFFPARRAMQRRRSSALLEALTA